MRNVIKESLDGTDWCGGENDERITLRDVLEYFEVNSIMPKEFDTRELFYKLSGGKKVLRIIKKGGKESEERVKTASLEYPIVVIKRDSKIEYVLDGNHRLQKAKNNIKENEHIFVLELDMDDPRILEEFVSMF
jgi:hypothetical protein